MLLHVPFIMLIAASRLAAFKSCILVSAISFTCSSFIEPTLFLFGSPLAFSSPIAFLINTGAGGVL